jgi:hypothetical protein
LYKRCRSTQEGTEREAKHTKESKHWLSQTFTSNHCAALLEKESEDQQKKADPENSAKSPPVCISDVKNISALIQLLEQIAKEEYEIKALADNQVKVQTKTSESYRIIIKALAEKHAKSHVKIKRRKMLQSSVKNMHYSINPEEIKI